MLTLVAVGDLSGTGARTWQPPARRHRGWLLLGLAGVGWVLVATMGLWWSWLWTRLGLISVPVDTLVWVVALILTVLGAPVLWHRFHRPWVVVCMVAGLVVGGTAIVLSPWHAVFDKAWTRVTCGAEDCPPPQDPPPYHWRIVKPK